MKLYRVEATYGRMGLPLLYIVAARDEDEASDLVLALDGVASVKCPDVIGDAYADEPCVIR